MSKAFDAQYFGRQYRGRWWRRAGSKPVLDASRVRWLRRRVRGGRFLEIGSGLGAFSRRAARSYDVIGLDLDPAVVRSAFVGTPVTGVSGSATQLPLRDESLDVVVCFDVLEHLPQPDLCLREMQRVLRPGGYVFLSVPNPESLGARRKGERSFIHRDPTHCSVLRMDEWRFRLARAGLVEVFHGTDGLWDPPYLKWLPQRLQWLLFVGASQLAWLLAPAFHWRQGENFVWLGRRAS